jgi:hypothetical protein
MYCTQPTIIVREEAGFRYSHTSAGYYLFENLTLALAEQAWNTSWLFRIKVVLPLHCASLYSGEVNVSNQKPCFIAQRREIYWQ